MTQSAAAASVTLGAPFVVFYNTTCVKWKIGFLSTFAVLIHNAVQSRSQSRCSGRVMFCELLFSCCAPSDKDNLRIFHVEDVLVRATFVSTVTEAALAQQELC